MKELRTKLSSLLNIKQLNEEQEYELGMIIYMLLKRHNIKLENNWIKKFIQLLKILYRDPYTKSKNLAESINASKKELIRLYQIIQKIRLFQDLFRYDPRYKTFFVGIMGELINNVDYTEQLLREEVVYPLTVELHLGEVCNNDCIYCYNRDARKYKNKNTKNKLTKETVVRLINELADNDIRNIFISGGLESLTSPLAKEVTRIAMDRGLSVALYTNGINLTEDLRQVFVNIRQVRFTLAAASPKIYHKIHNPKLPYKQAKAIFNRIKNNISELVRLRQRLNGRVKIGIAFVIIPENFSETSNIVEMGKILGVDFVDIRLDRYAMTRDFTKLELRTIREDIRRILKRIDAGGFGEMQIDIHKRFLTTDDEQPQMVHYKPKYCRATAIKSTVNPWGEVFRCCLTAQPGIEREIFKIGRINAETPYYRIIDNYMKAYREFDPGVCQSCTTYENNLNVALEKLEEDLKFGISIGQQPFAFGIIDKNFER